MTLSVQEFEAFKALVDEPLDHKERECQDFLIHAAGLLIPSAPTQIVELKEDRNFFGRADFIIGAEISDGALPPAKHAYIWELKAPQCHLFEFGTQNRCNPTVAFLQAENQLLHYFHEASGNDRFRQRMNVMDQDNIHIGGIVIGTRARMLRGSNENNKAHTALIVRQKYLYKAFGIRVLTWDAILDFVRPFPFP